VGVQLDLPPTQLRKKKKKLEKPKKKKKNNKKKKKKKKKKKSAGKMKFIFERKLASSLLPLFRPEMKAIPAW
jgi:hypothetical protein